MTVNIGRNIETVILIGALAINAAGIIWVARHDWKRYGFIVLLSGILGSGLCYIFVLLGYYTFPHLLIPGFLPFPFESILTAFSFYVLLGIRYSPTKWLYKVPFYGIIINPGVFAEFLMERHTQLIKYQPAWDLWDSYTTWWIYFLLFEWIGGKVVPENARAPIAREAFAYGKWAWFLFHIIVLLTTFGVGVLAGTNLPK
ncbi:MAG: CBO0543 family protein [Sporomusaceae bacterium]|nr:CBO0543 family protein [Sporomusaceae bacterium]